MGRKWEQALELLLVLQEGIQEFLQEQLLALLLAQQLEL